MDNSVELEFKLAVTATADQVLAELSGANTIAGCSVGGAQTKILEDRYFDSTDGCLGKAGIALRIRVESGQASVAIKADERIADNGLVERFEWERRWQSNTGTELAKALSRLGSEINIAGNGNHDPLAFMSDAGFIVLQHRKTERIVRHLQCDAAMSSMELALDRTWYQVNGKPDRRIEHCELELEIDSIDRDIAAAVIRKLTWQYPGLRAWRHNKLVTGLALPRFLVDATPNESIGRLSDQQYEQLDRFINNTMQR
ncbi:MAG: CYTH domain-containing protein [Gammaproteobacteria bacterium]|nr:CYTH domain-containing protein [Gammaproteobacteria bacterium]